MWSYSAESVGFSNHGKIKNLPSRCCSRNIDLKLRWKTAQEKLGAHVEVRKVKAHQDQLKKYEDLSSEEKRNVDCDEEAGRKVK